MGCGRFHELIHLRLQTIGAEDFDPETGDSETRNIAVELLSDTCTWAIDPIIANLDLLFTLTFRLGPRVRDFTPSI